jgi:protocatechuate 3,4-dioxygenase beta subunit
MRRGTTLRLRVVDDAGPVPGATLEVPDLFTVTTDAQGIASLAGMSPGSHRVEATAAEHAPATLRIDLPDDPGSTVEHTLTLHRGAPVSGTVIGPDGKPVAGARVWFSVPAGNWSATCDARGAWRFDALPAGTFTASASSDRHRAGPDLTVELDGKTARTDIVVRVETGGQLVGSVVDGAGKPVAGAQVNADGRESTTDAAGRFELLGLEPGSYDVIAQADTRSSRTAKVSVTDGGRAEVRLVLEEATIAGTVVDPTGEPVAGIRVTAVMDFGIRDTNIADDVTDARGHFELRTAAHGIYKVSARWDQQDRYGFTSASRDATSVRTGVRDVKLVMPRAAQLTGRVLLDGKPLPAFAVAVPDTELAVRSTPVGFRGEDGRFTLRGLDRGVVQVGVVAPGTARKVLEDVQLVEGQTTDLGDIAMVRGARLRGQVRDVRHAPIEDATVTLGRPYPFGVDASPPWFRGVHVTTTDATGSFRFDGVDIVDRRGRPLEISATHPRRGASAAQRVASEHAAIELVLHGLGGIDGRLDGLGEAGMLRLTSKSPAKTELVTVLANGEFHSDDLLAGEYTVTLAAPQGKPAPTPATITVIANQRTTVTLTLPK